MARDHAPTPPKGTGVGVSAKQGRPVVVFVIERASEPQRVIVLGVVVVGRAGPRIVQVVEVVGTWWSRWAGGARA